MVRYPQISNLRQRSCVSTQGCYYYYLSDILTLLHNNTMAVHEKNKLCDQCPPMIKVQFARVITVQWSSGYDFCLTHRRSPVRSWIGPLIFFKYKKSLKKKTSYTHTCVDRIQFFIH